MVIQNSYVTAFASWFNAWPVAAVTIWPFVFVSDEVSESLLQHERIHLQQQTELFLIGFYVLYAWYWLRAWLDDPNFAYMANPFEMEAYRYEREPGYMYYRPAYAWREFVDGN